VGSAERVLGSQPEIDLFLLDDGMQHRRVLRQMEIVLVSATQGLCGGHVLPRGLLRERPKSLARADCIVLTRCDQVDDRRLRELESEVDSLAPGRPVFHTQHLPTGVVTSDGERWSPESLRGRRVFALAGTGDPEAFGRTLTGLQATLAGSMSFADHHPYSAADLAEVGRRARAAGAEAILTTGKDYAKLRHLGRAEGLEIWTLRIEIRFRGQGDGELLDLVRSRLNLPAGGPPRPS
jgi:tetraacyldisaccharide 4'-kinase